MTDPETNERKLVPQAVEDLMKTCLAVRNEADVKDVEGIMQVWRFDVANVQKQKNRIAELLDELPDNFKVGFGDGWTFLNACHDKHGNLWTGVDSIIDQLFSLGMAADMVRVCLPRELWSTLPGEMPYYAVDTNGIKSKTSNPPNPSGDIQPAEKSTKSYDEHGNPLQGPETEDEMYELKLKYLGLEFMKDILDSRGFRINENKIIERVRNVIPEGSVTNSELLAEMQNRGFQIPEYGIGK